MHALRPVLISLLVLVPAAARAACTTGGGIANSTNYCLKQATLNGGGTTSVSPTGTNYRLTASLGQESVIGTSSSNNYVLQSGFWSFVGSGLVPVVLMVAKNGSNPANPDLSWSGNNSPYTVYRIPTACGTIFTGFLTTQVPKTYTDAAPPAAALVCYNVQATAPGPEPPPGLISPNPSGSLDASPEY